MIRALKKVKMDKEREGFPLTALREANILLSMQHPNIVGVTEMVMGNSLDSIFMVMEFAEHDLKGLMETMTKPFTIPEVKCLMLQLLGVSYLHDNWVIHRDLKTSNILVNNRGELKLCDFGLARQYSDPLRPYTHMVVTLWYRAPELLLGQRLYSTGVDVWSLGCIMGELLCKDPLFQGKTRLTRSTAYSGCWAPRTRRSGPTSSTSRRCGRSSFPTSRTTTCARSSRRYPPTGASPCRTPDSTCSTSCWRTTQVGE